MATNEQPSSGTDSVTASFDQDTGTITTPDLGEIQLQLPASWQVGEPEYDDSGFAAIHTKGNTRIDLKLISFASHNANTGILAELYIEETPFTYAEFHRSDLAITASDICDTIQSMIDDADHVQ